MKRGVKTSLLLLLITSLVVTLYCSFVINRAKKETPAIVSAALNSKNISLKYSDLTPWQLNVLLTVEDPNFYHHGGMDMSTPGAGATTITQALVKLLYAKRSEPGFGKIDQTLIAAYALDPAASKNDQLTLFINNAYLGNIDGRQVIGFSNAAKCYYHKTFAQLDSNEYISIVAMIISPNNFHIINKPAENRGRSLRIKRLISGEYKPKSLTDVYYDK